jgi:hypothetical protein
MKKYLTLVFLLIIFNSFCQFNEDYDIELYKSLEIQFEVVYEYQSKFGEIDLSTKFLKERNEYNNKGQLIKYEKFYESEYIKEYEEVKTYSYINENMTKIVTYDIYGTIKGIIKYLYEDGRNTERLFYSREGKLTSIVKYQFDKSGNYIGYSSFSGDGKIENKVKNKYNADNKLIKSTYFDKKNNVKSYTIYIRKNKKEEYKSYNAKNEIEVRSIEKLNDKGLVIEQLYFYSSDIPTKTIYKYNENDLVIKRTKFAKNGEPKKYEKIERY